MPRNGRDLFDRSDFTVNRTPSAQDILSGNFSRSNASGARTRKPRAEKPKEAPQPTTGAMSRQEAESVAKGLSDPTASSLGKDDVVRERIVRVLTNELPEDPNKWDKSGERQINKVGIDNAKAQTVAYILARDAGVLRGGEKDVIKQVQRFENLIGKRSEEIEYQVVIDKNGNLIHAIKGDKGAVGMGAPTDALGIPIKAIRGDDKYDYDLRKVYAGSTMHHNHPRHGEEGALGMTFSAPDLANTVKYARSAITATAKEGIYIGTNRKWEEHATGSRKDAYARATRFGSEIAAARRLVANEYSSRVKAGRLPYGAEAAYRFQAVRNHAANIIIAKRYGIEIDFIPKAGYEWIKTEAEALAAGIGD